MYNLHMASTSGGPNSFHETCESTDRTTKHEQPIEPQATKEPSQGGCSFYPRSLDTESSVANTKKIYVF
jgi:hypothetical protein